MTKSFKDALSRTSRPIPGIKDSNPRFSTGSTSTSTSKLNPFNLKVSKPKFDVLNRNVIGSRGNTANSRTRAVAVRSATLLPQLQEKNRAHVSSFVDRRFGVKDSTLSREEVMQERFSREQQRLVRRKQTGSNQKKNKFDLNSIDESVEEDSDEAVNFSSLTHGGKSISQMDDDELENYDQDLDDDENDQSYNSRGHNGQLDRELVAAAHFGGSKDEKKSKQDVMKELIAKSKFYKHERQKIKEENEALVEDVNEAFAAIRGNLKVLTEEDRKKLREVKSDISNETSNTINDEDGQDDYETTLKELAFDPRSKPSDRTLTAEEQEQKDKKKFEDQSKALLERMKPAVDLNEEDQEAINGDLDEEIDPELKKIGERQGKLMRHFCHFGDLESYVKLVEYAKKQPRTMIQLAKQIRSDLGKLSTSFTKRSNKSGRGALMPSFGPIRLLLLISRIFSCSDYHHVVSTPAQLLLSYYLGVGRITKFEHVKRALGLVYCVVQFQEVGGRCVPEALQVLYTILSAATTKDDNGAGDKDNIASSKYTAESTSDTHSASRSKTATGSPSHYFCRPMSRSVIETLKNCKKSTKDSSPPIEASKLFEKDSTLTPNQLLGLTVSLLEKYFAVLEKANYPALKEAARPFAILIPKNELMCGFAYENSRKTCLQLQNHKPLSIPLLTPDFAADYSMEHRKRSGMDADEQGMARIKRAHKREYKGAVRELKRDAAFLAAHKLKETRRMDSEYKSKMNKIIGSIGNGN